MTRTRKVLSTIVVVVAFALAFAMTAFNDVEPTFGGPDWCVGLEGRVPECPAIPSS